MSLFHSRRPAASSLRLRPAKLGRAAAVAALTLSITALGGVQPSFAAEHASAAGSVSASALRLHDQMRELWDDHITYTRLAIVSFAGDLPDLGPTETRLLQNQTDLGNAFKPFYGNAAGNHLTSLLRVHILTAVDILVAAKAGDAAKLAAAERAWYDNANEIADFLHSLNPRHWSDADLRAMMKHHLDLTLKEAGDRLEGHYAQDIADFDQVHQQVLGMADMLSDGIIEAFPRDFRH
ncbi:hypothetical protein [Actinospica robiniae]|uniref:hypothetical protein n=1 Tax=Actinospica robiniae TaxID=304901 RepID=UPI000424642B|nr:hypothetical protein [Actinospica robiniae]